MLSIESQNGSIVFYNRAGERISQSMSCEKAIALLRRDNDQKEERQKSPSLFS